MSKPRVVLIVMLLVGLAVMSCRGLGTGDSEFSEKDLTREKLQQYEKLMQITFPETTRALNSYNEISGPDDAVYLKVEIDQNDLDTLVSKSPFSTAEFRSDQRRLQNLSNLTWWTPEGAKTFKSSQVRLSTGNVLTMLVDLDDAKKPIVYLLWYEM